jgi:hypothetical protein
MNAWGFTTTKRRLVLAAAALALTLTSAKM